MTAKRMKAWRTRPRKQPVEANRKKSVAYRICCFANGECGCQKRRSNPCEALRLLVLDIFELAKERSE